MSYIAFSLPALDQAFTVIPATLEGAAPPTLDFSAVAVYNVKLSDMLAVFKYQSDSFDVSNAPATDIKYYVDSGAWPANLNPVHASMNSGEMLATGNGIVAAKNLVKHDFVRFLADHLFNTPHGVDLFSNEDDLLSDLVTKGATAATAIETALGNVNHANAVGGVDADTLKYSTNAQNTDTNICRELMLQIIDGAASRFGSISDSTAKQSVPIIAGDSLNFVLSVSAAEDQDDLTGVGAFDVRKYKIQLNVVDSATPSNTVPVEADSSTEYPYHAV
jgi:hypothetical protein